MGFWKTTVKGLVGTVKVATNVGVRGVKLASDGISGGAKFVSKHRDTIASVATTAVDATATAVAVTGAVVLTGAARGAKTLHALGSGSDGVVGKALGHAGGLAADAIAVVGGATFLVGTLAEKTAPAIGAATGGVAVGATKVVSGTLDAVTLTDGDFDKLRERLQAASRVVKERADARERAIRAAQRLHRKKDLLDLLVVGGITVADILRSPDAVPPEIERAFELAYPGLASSGETFADAAGRMSSDELVGLVSGVKGKLFEIELVDYLNHGHLPDGLHAELATSATQPGYDIQIFDQQHRVVDVLQAKATESAHYVLEALHRYPGIDVTTTDEVYAQLIAHGTAAHVTNSGISEEVLQQKVEAAILAGHHVGVGDLVPSTVGLAIIALSSFRDGSLTLEQRAGQFGERGAKAGFASVAGKAALIASGYWWAALAAGVGTRLLTTYGGNKRQRYDELLDLTRSVEQLACKAKAPGRTSHASA